MGSLGGVGYWTATNNNGVFDDQTLRFIAERAGLQVIRSPLEGTDAQYDYAQVISRMGAISPDLPVLMYAWATNMRARSTRIEQEVLAGYEELGDLLLPTDTNPNGLPLYGDVTNEGYRLWLRDRVSTFVAQTGAAGVAFDLVYRNCTFRPRYLNAYCTDDPDYANEYPTSVELLLDEVKADIGGMVMYNGIWNFRNPDEPIVETQKLLLNHADAVLIEYFGLNPPFGYRGWELDVAPYLSLTSEFPNKQIMFAGRGTWDPYRDYAVDYLWQRYLYGVYLLIANENTLFKYHSTFQIPTGRGRAGGLDTYHDWDVDLGSPSGDYVEDGDLYRRHFTKGLVLVVRDDAESPQSYQLSTPMVTPEGERVDGEVQLDPGTSLILVDKSERGSYIPNPDKVEDFEAASTPFASWRWASIKAEGQNHFLSLIATPTDEQWEHDLMLEGVRTLRPRPDWSATVRTTDPDAHLKLVIEIDDVLGEHQYALIGVDADSGTPGPTSLGFFPSYRARDTNVPDIPHIRAGVALTADGEWSQLAVSADSLLAGTDEGRYTFHRWSHMVMIGTMDVDDIIIGGGGGSVADAARPDVTLVAPTVGGPFQSLQLQVDATDEIGLRRIVANIYQGATLVKSTQTQMHGATSGTHTADVSLPDGSYTIRYNAQDLAGNISQTSTLDVTIDTTSPTVTVKNGPGFTVGADGVYEKVSFKLHDAGKIDKVVLNGVVKDLSNNTWSDVNYVRPGRFGAVLGENTLVVHDVAGNATTLTFTLT